jgi:TolB protein
MQDSGANPVPVTDPPKAGLWGQANLPFGDYDPRLSPDGNRIAFERLEDDTSPHGNYNIYVINTDGSEEIRLTNTGYSQGIISWSHKADKMVFIVGAIGDAGKYDIYLVDADGSNIVNITPTYFPPDFLCHTPVFSIDDSKIFFIGEWYE